MGPSPNNLLFYHLCASDFSYLVIFLSHYRIYKWLMQNIKKKYNLEQILAIIQPLKEKHYPL